MSLTGVRNARRNRTYCGSHWKATQIVQTPHGFHCGCHYGPFGRIRRHGFDRRYVVCVRSFTATNIRLGQVVIHSLNTPESYSFDHKRPMRSIALEPNFSKRGTRSFVCGGLAGNLILHEKGWLGHRETILHNGEGPIWQVRWRGALIAWANDLVSEKYRCAHPGLTRAY